MVTLHLSKLYPNHIFSLLDLNENAINGVKELLSSQSEKDEFFICDMFETPFPDNHFDAVFCWHTLSWTNEPKRLIDELIRTVDNGGSVIYQ